MAWQEKLRAFDRRVTIRHRLALAGVLFMGWVIGILAFDSGAVFLLIAAFVVVLGIIPRMPAGKRERL